MLALDLQIEIFSSGVMMIEDIRQVFKGTVNCSSNKNG
jgi:hypothetical protein